MSERHKRRSARSAPRSVGRRLVLALAAGGLALFSVADSLANAIAPVTPEMAHKLAPWNGKIMAEEAQRSFQQKADYSAKSGSAALARQALKSEPTAVEALAVLGLQAQLRQETGRSRDILAHALLLSRRELSTRLWTIEEASLRGDIDGALTNYDIALRTSSQAPARLFSPLAGALVEPRIRAKLLTILARKPLWRDDFLNYAATSGSQPRAVAEFFREAGRKGIPVAGDVRTALVDNLANHGLYDEAWAYYASIRTDAARDRSRDPRFTFAGNNRSLFDWNVTDYASFQSGAAGGVLDFVVPSTTGGTLASQASVLPPGHYLLHGTSAHIEEPEASRPYWSLWCGTRQVGQVDIGNSPNGEGRFSGTLTVPSGCPLQTLTLVARSTDNSRGVTGQITSVQVEPAR